MAGLRAEGSNSARLLVIYYKADGAEVFRDTGPRIVMRDKGEGSLEAALRVAAQNVRPPCPKSRGARTLPGASRGVWRPVWGLLWGQC